MQAMTLRPHRSVTSDDAFQAHANFTTGSTATDVIKMKPLEAINMNVFGTNETIRRELRHKHQMRQWVTPCTIGAFILTALTGILLFFKVNPGLIKPAHEWLSWLLVISTLLHLFVNWRPSVHALSRPVGKGILAVFLLFTCIAFLPLDGSRHKQHSSKWLAEALIHAPLTTVAQLANHDADEMAEILSAQGIHLKNREQTIEEIAADNNKRSLEILAMIL
jgi:Icc-related predicted phosphoesterase